jgi:hypothetical protein
MDIKERWRAYNQKYHAKQTVENAKDYRSRKIFNQRKIDARKAGVPFEITLKYIQELPAEICPIFKIPLVWGGKSHNTASLDRIIPAKGYVEGNVHWISLRANLLKRDSTKEENAKLYEWFQTI